MQKVPLSAVVLTKNEEDNIRPCLESVVGWADEIIVVDDGSRDNTRQIAGEQAHRVLSRATDNEGAQRNWAYAQASREWVLALDADERVTPELQDEIDKVLPGTSCQAFAIPSRNYIGATWVRYGGWYPASKLKLFRQGRFRYEEVEIHPRIFVDGETGTLTKDILHRSYRNFEHFLEKLNRHTTLEAQKWLRTGQRMTAGRISRRTVDRFFRSYLRKRGFKDGLTGFMVAYFASMYQILSYAKYREMREGGPEHAKIKKETSEFS